MTRTPAQIFPPGDFIREELEERGWKQEDLAKIMGRPLPTINQIIVGRTAITPETAHELAEAFGTSAELWMNLESSFRLANSQKPEGAVSKRARLYEVAPVREMIRRRWIKKTQKSSQLEAELKRFFKVDTLDCDPELAAAARSSAPEEDEVIASQTAWCFRALQLASTIRASRFSKKAFQDGQKVLRSIAKQISGVQEIPCILEKMGVRFVVVEHLRGTKIDGAALWLDPKKKTAPVVVLSMRHKRIDCFWHTLCHELSHILHGDSTIDVSLVGDDRSTECRRSDIETRADKEAAEMLIPIEELDRFIVRVQPFFSKDRIRGFAKRIGVHPGIVVGQLQHRELIGYHANREMLIDVREHIIESALTDGWGHYVDISF